MSEREAYERILASLHEAALDDTHWSTASKLIDETLRVYGNSFALCDLHSEEDIQFYLTGMFYHGQRDLDLERDYFDAYYSRDERIPLVRQLPDCQPALISDLYSKEELRTSVIYNDFFTVRTPRTASAIASTDPWAYPLSGFFTIPSKVTTGRPPK